MPRPTRTHWVTRNSETGQLESIAVTDMTTAHLLRTIRYLRQFHGPQFQDIENADERVLAIDRHLVGFRHPAQAMFEELRRRGIDLIGNPFQNLDTCLDEVLAAEVTRRRPHRGGEVEIGLAGNRRRVEVRERVVDDLRRQLERNEYGIRDALTQLGFDPSQPVRRQRARTRRAAEAEYEQDVADRRETARLQAPKFPNRRRIRVD